MVSVRDKWVNFEMTFNPLVPDTHYNRRQDNPFSLQIQRLEVDLKLNRGFLFFAPWGLTGCVGGFLFPRPLGTKHQWVNF